MKLFTMLPLKKYNMDKFVEKMINGFFREPCISGFRTVPQLLRI